VVRDTHSPRKRTSLPNCKPNALHCARLSRCLKRTASLDHRTDRAIIALGQNKTLAVQALNKLANARKSTLLARGAKTDPGGIEAWLQAHAADSLPVWHDIQNMAAHAQQMNRSNGELIQVKLRNNQQALTVLRNAVNSASGLYGPDGQPHLPTSGRTLGSG